MSLTYNDLVADLAAHIGLDPKELLATEEIVVDDQVIGLQLDGHETVGDLLFFTVLGAPDPDHFPRIARTLLEANNFWIGTGGCTRGLQRESGDVTLCGRIALGDLSGQTLAGLLDSFVDTASFWRAFVNGGTEAPVGVPQLSIVPRTAA